MGKSHRRITWVLIGIVNILISFGLIYFLFINNTGIWIFVAIMGIIFLCCIWLMLKKTTDHSCCPKCNKVASMKEIKRTVILSTPANMKIKRQKTNAEGEVIGTYRQTVPATKYLYDCTDECIFCGYQRKTKRKAKYNN